MSTKKKASAAAGVLAVALAVGGAYAWTDYSQSARNTFHGNVAADVLLHDDFNGENKDVYVENTGDSAVYVRVKFAEYLQIGNVSVLPAYGADSAVDGYERANPQDVTTWPVHQFANDVDTDNKCSGNAASAHNYYTWNMTGAQKAYLAGVTEADPNGRGGLTQEAFDALTFDADVTIGTIVTQKKLTSAAQPVMLLSEYMDMEAAARPTNGCWLLDTDGWAYWSNALQPGTATNLLLDEVTLKDAVPYDNWVYNIDVQLQAASVNEMDYWYADGNSAPVADPDNSIATTTTYGFNFVQLKGGNYFTDSDGVTMDEDGVRYISLGSNVYQAAVASGTGYIVDGSKTPVLAGQDGKPGNADDNMLAGRSAADNGGIAVASIDTDAMTYTLQGADTKYVVTSGIDKKLGTYDDVITATDGTLGSYEIDGDNSATEYVGWNYLGGSIDNMLVATEYVLDNTVYDSDLNDGNNDYSQSALKTKIEEIGTALNMTATVNSVTLDMSECSGSYVYVCTNSAHTTDADHASGCSYSYSRYYTSNDGQDYIPGTKFFALSIDEVLAAYGDSTDAAIRQLRIVQGAPAYLDTEENVAHTGLNYNNTASWKDGNGNVISTTNYWLRSPGYTGTRAVL